MGEYISTFIKTLIFISVIVLLFVGSIFGIHTFAKYQAENAIMDKYLISSQKINNIDIFGYNFNPEKLELTTEDGVYLLTSSDKFKTLDSVKTLYGENYELREKVIQYLKDEGVDAVKRGSLTYKNKGVYEAYDFETKHTFIITYDSNKETFSKEYKEID